MFLPILLGVLFLVGWYVSGSSPSREKAPKLPPGPPGLPILGNALQLPCKFIYRKFVEWKEKYGDIYMISAAGQRIVVLSKAKVAADIMDRMSAQTSGRPTFEMATLMHRNMSFAVALPTNEWRRSRRITHENFNIRAVSAHYPVLESTASELISGLLENPTDLYKSILRFSGYSVWRALYGESETNIDGAIDSMAKFVGAIATNMSPTGSIINIFPFLRYLPESISPWKQAGNRFYVTETNRLLSFARLGLSQSTSGETGFVASCARSRDTLDDVADEEIAWTAGSLFSAAFETSSYSLYFFCMAMVLYPEVAKKAQMELDTVCGTHLPTFEDFDRLQYIQALVKELLRWRPVTPAGLPHMSTEDFVYQDYFIPKGTWIFVNMWAMCHDSEVFKDPETFQPERYLDASGNIKLAAPDYHYEDLITFGYGRRMCPGRHFAMNSLFISMARLLWAFDFAKAKDAGGKELTPSSTDLLDENIFIHPAPFPYELKPRRTDLVDILPGAAA